MIVTVTLTPALDKTVVLPGFRVDQVNRIESLRLDPGGKGINVSKVLRSLGTKSLATGILGGGTGKYIEDSLTALGIACDFVHVPQETRTNLKVVDPQLHTNTDINEPGAPADEDTLEAVFQTAQAAAAAPGSIVVLAGKAPAGTRDTVFAEWIARLKEKGVRVYMDADAGLLAEGVKARPALIKPNDAELGRLTGQSFASVDDIAQAARELASGGIETVVVSLGGEGALFVTAEQTIRGYGLRVPVQSTVGAGDSMMAAMAHGAATGMTFRDTCALAMAVSAAAVTTPGTQPADADIVAGLLKQVRLEEI
ncbi:MAG: 1-phosphofructokinase [Clostridia bacterium]|nr:1-phosphofructokinase [Clostridia bacterium]